MVKEILNRNLKQALKKLKIDENKYFGFADKRQFEMEKDKVNWARKIIEDYKKEKGQLISR